MLRILVYIKSIVFSLLVMLGTNVTASDQGIVSEGYVVTSVYDIVNPLQGGGAEFNAPTTQEGLYGGSLLYPRASDKKPVPYYVDEVGKVHLGASVRDLYKQSENRKAEQIVDLGANAVKLDVSKEIVKIRVWDINNHFQRVSVNRYLPGLQELFGDLKYPKGYVKVSAFMNTESHILRIYVARTKWVNNRKLLGKIYILMPRERE